MYFPLLMLLEKAGIFLAAEAARPIQSVMLQDIRLLTPEFTEYQAHTLYVGQTPPHSLPVRTEQDTWCILLSRPDGEDVANFTKPSMISEVSENAGLSAILPVTASENLFVLVTNHQFNWWFDDGPIRAIYCSA